MTLSVPTKKQWRVDRWPVKTGLTTDYVALREGKPGCNLQDLMKEVDSDKKAVYGVAREKVDDFLFLVANCMDLQNQPINSIKSIKTLLGGLDLEKRKEATFFLFYFSRDIVYPDVMRTKLERKMVCDILGELDAELLVPEGLTWNRKNHDCVTASFNDQYDRRRERICAAAFKGDGVSITIKRKGGHPLPSGKVTDERPKWQYYTVSKDKLVLEVVRPQSLSML
jgi:hypothetical protein